MDIQKLILHIQVERILLYTQFNKLRSIIQLGIQYSAVVLDIHGCCFTISSLFININISIFGYPLFYL